MREPRGDPALVQELLDERALRREVREDELQRDQPREPVHAMQAREVELRHAALPELAQQLVSPHPRRDHVHRGYQLLTMTSAVSASCIRVAPPPGARWRRRGPARPASMKSLRQRAISTLISVRETPGLRGQTIGATTSSGIKSPGLYGAGGLQSAMIRSSRRSWRNSVWSPSLAEITMRPPRGRISITTRVGPASPPIIV